MRRFLIITLVLCGLGFTTFKGATIKGGEWTKQNVTIPADSITYINGSPWTGIAGDYITEVN